MIELCRSDAITRFVDRIERRPAHFFEVGVSSPFIDGYGAALLERLAVAATRGEFVLRVVTRPETLAIVDATLRVGSRSAGVKSNTVVHTVAGLHAKLYGALALQSAEHEVIVTSANLTQAGLTRNLELGVRVTGSEKDHVALAERMVGWTRARSTESRLTY